MGASLALQLSASDPEGESVIFGVSPLPLVQNATLDALNGLFVFKPNTAQVGTLELTFLVSDGQGGSDSEAVNITVEAPPPGGVTALVGRILDANDFVDGTVTPVVGATVSILGTGVSVVSGADGRFVITEIPSDTQVFNIDATTASAAPDSSPYAGFRESIELIAGAKNVVDRPFFLPRIAVESLTPVNPSATTIVTNETLGVTLAVPPTTAKLSDGSNFTGEISISLVPEALAPAALPENLEPGMLITLQTVGVTFSTPVPITFPNIDNLTPGSETDLWSLDSDAGTFVVVGTGRVSADGSVIETISGGIRANDWHAVLPPGSEPRVPDGSSDRVCGCRRLERQTGSATSVHSGNLMLDHTVPEYVSMGSPHGPRLVYNSTNADPQPIISTEATIVSRAAVPSTVSASLMVGGVSQAVEAFTDTSGLDENLDETFLQAIQFDASGHDSGAYPYRLRVTSNYMASSISSTVSGEVLVNKQRRSPLGAGWTLASLHRMYPREDGSILVIEGDGSALAFAEEFDVLLEDTFDTENDGRGVLNYTNLSNWDVTVGSIDVIGNGFFDLLPGNGLYIDLDGTSAQAGTLESKVDFRLAPGQYLLEFKLAGSARRDTNSVTVALGAVFTETFILESDAPLMTVTRAIEVSIPTTAKLSFKHDGGDNLGLLLDDVALKRKGDRRSFVSPPADFSTLVENDDGTFTRTQRDGTQIAFDAWGLQTSVVDRNDNATGYSYDGQGWLVSITDPVGLVTQFTYDRGGLLLTIDDPAGRTTRFEHDGEGNLVRITDPDGTSRQFAYDVRHRVVSQTDKRGFVTRYEYNSGGRHVKSTMPDNSTREISSAEIMALADPTDGRGASDNPAVVVRPEGAVATFTDGNDNTTTYRTNRFGSATEVIDAAGQRSMTPRDRDGLSV